MVNEREVLSLAAELSEKYSLLADKIEGALEGGDIDFSKFDKNYRPILFRSALVCRQRAMIYETDSKRDGIVKYFLRLPLVGWLYRSNLKSQIEIVDEAIKNYKNGKCSELYHLMIISEPSDMAGDYFDYTV